MAATTFPPSQPGRQGEATHQAPACATTSDVTDVPVPDPATAWETAALEALPAAARRTLVLACSDRVSELRRWSRTPLATGPAARSERLPPPGSRGASPEILRLGGDPWDAVVAGPGVLGAPGAAAELSRACDSLVPGGRVVVVAAAGEEARGAERTLLAIGCAIRRQVAIGGANATTPGAPSSQLVLFSAQHDGYRMRVASDGDVSAILDLFARSFHVERPMAHWLWKYRDSPFGNGRIALAYAPNGELVAQYCAYPLRLYRTGAGVVEIQQVGDTMTAQAARAVGRGPTSVLARVARFFYAEFCDGRVAFNYGFNTGNIQQFGIRFLGVHKVADAPYRELRLDGPPRTGGWLRRLFGGTSVREITTALELDDRFDELFVACRDSYGALVERDSRYLRWRYAGRPDLRYRILAVERGRRLCGWGVFTRRGDAVVWGDALFRPAEVESAAALLEAATRTVAPEAPIARVVGWFPPHPAWWDAFLERLGFARQPEPQELALGVAPFVDTEAHRWTGESLYYTYGDSDLF